MANERRLIDADELEDKLYDNEFSILCPLDEVTGVIDCCTTVDAVEVVRCEDCQYGNSNYPVQDGQCVCEYYDFIIRDYDDFCSRGER